MTERTVSQRIANVIHNQILQRRYGPGDKLPTERELAQSHGVSRIPVREAMKILEQRGIVESKHGSGNYVKSIDEEKLIEQISQYLLLCSGDLHAVHGFWRILERHAAASAALTRTPQQLDSIKRLADDCATEIKCALAGQTFAFSAADLALHTAIAEAADNKIVTNMVKVLHRSVRLKDSLLGLQPTVLGKLLGIHDALVLGIERQDPEMAVRAAEADFALGDDIHKTLTREYKLSEIYGA